MKFTGKIDVEPVRNYYGHLAFSLRQSLPRTIRMEAAATVRKAIQLDDTKRKSAEYLTASSMRTKLGKFYDGGGIGGSINSSTKKGTPGMAWIVRLDLGGKVMPLHNTGWDGSSKLPIVQDNQGTGAHVSDAHWSKWKSAMKRAIEYAQKLAKSRIGARGLTQKSWWELMQKIAADEPVNAPATIMRAVPVKGGSRTVAAAIGQGGEKEFGLTIINASGIAIKTDGQRKLNAAIEIRRAFFYRSLLKGFYEDAKFVARNYKWVRRN